MHYLKLQLSLAATAGCIVGAVAQSCGSGCPLYTLAFNDEFGESAVDTTVWNYRTDEKGESAQLSSNVVVGGGYMNITLAKETVGSYQYTGGGLLSKPNFHYGFYEARMRLNNGSGWHSSFWQMAGNGATTTNSASPNWTEIDTFEVDSVSPMDIRHNIFSWHDDSSGQQQAEEITSGVHEAAVSYADDFHVFGTLWNESSVSFYTDGAVVSAFEYPALMYPHDLLNIWITCIAYEYTVDDSYLPNHISTDYVRFYQKDYYITATSLCRGTYQGTTPCPSTTGYSETGAWSESILDGYTVALKSRYSCNVAGNTASWSQAVSAAGTYQISAWIIGSNSDPAATYLVKRNGSVLENTTMNQNTNPPAWTSLATAVVAAGDVIEVTVRASGSGCTRSDTVRLIRVA